MNTAWLDLLRELGAVCIVAVLVLVALFLVMTIGAVIADLFADERASARLDRIISEELAPAEIPAAPGGAVMWSCSIDRGLHICDHPGPWWSYART